jgi:hypothetical protein
MTKTKLVTTAAKRIGDGSVALLDARVDFHTLRFPIENRDSSRIAGRASLQPVGFGYLSRLTVRTQALAPERISSVKLV